MRAATLFQLRHPRRLGLLIVLAMLALVGYAGVNERSNEEKRAHENLERLAIFAATAERT